MHRLTLAAAALAATLAATLAAASPALSEDARMPRLISLSGHGEMRMAPDMAFVTTGVLSQGVTAAEALAANTAAMNALFAALMGAGIAEKDVQTSNFFVQPRYNFQDGKAPELIGYDVSNTVTVIVRKIGDLGPLLDKVVQAGSNQINGIGFEVSKPDAALDEARKLATADATRKAKIYAEAMGVSLGRVMSISEGVNDQPPMPMARGKVMMADAAAAPVPVAAGEQTLSVDVNITWEIQ
jgi:uncharacterized protein YggE